MLGWPCATEPFEKNHRSLATAPAERVQRPVECVEANHIVNPKWQPLGKTRD